MLWDIIRDWFVQYIFGGYASDGNYYYGIVGNNAWVEGDNINTSISDNSVFYLPMQGWNADELGAIKYISLADWLSTTATIITLIAGCVLLFLLVKWLFKLFAGMISGVGR